MKITQYSYRSSKRGKVLFANLENGAKELVADFSPGNLGDVAFGHFVGSLALTRGAPSLFNEDTGEYTVGTMDQLVPGLRG